MVKNLLSEVMVRRKRVFDTTALANAIESGYAQKREPEFKTKKSFSPSTLVWGAGCCPRYWHLAFNGAMYAPESDINPRNIASMANGTASHERIQRAMENAGILSGAEIRVTNDDPPIFGFCDAEIEWEGKIIPTEIKTIREEAFNYRKVSGEAADYHVAQLLFYMRERQRDLGAVVYESKNSHELLIVPIEMTPERQAWLDQTYDWMRKVYAAWKAGKLAKKPFRSNSKICKACPLQAVCASTKAGNVEIEKLEMLG